MGANMDNATVASVGKAMGWGGNGPAPGASCHQMPLSFLRAGESARIAKVRDKGDLHHHLENLGFVEGAEVKVLNEAKGDLIVEVKGAQVAIDRHVAARIIASA